MFKNSSPDQILISNTCKVGYDDFDLIEKMEYPEMGTFINDIFYCLA